MGKIFVTKYVAACLTCRCCNVPKVADKSQILERTYEAEAAREVLNIDIIPSLSPSMGNTCMIIVVDEYSCCP